MYFFMLMSRAVACYPRTPKDWEKLLNYAHIIVANRSGESDEPKAQELKQWIKQHQTNQLTALNEKLFGYIYFINK